MTPTVANRRRPRVVERGRAAATVMDAARSLPQPFQLESLVVAAWVLRPDLFGLRGYEQLFPDAKEVQVELYGRRRGLVWRGLLRRVAPKTYEVIQ